MSRGICQCVSVRNSTQQNHIIRLYFSSKRVQMFPDNPEVSLSGSSWPPSSAQGSIELFFLSLRSFLFQVEQKTASLILHYNNIIIFQ